MIALGSKVSKALLSHFFLHSDDKLYVNEIAGKLGLDKRNLVKKLKDYENEGLFKTEKMGNQLYYSLNKKYPLYNEYRKIILKTIGIESSLKEALKGRKEIKAVYIFGSYAVDIMDSSSDIDVLVDFKEGAKTFDSFMELKFFLEDLFHRKVDLVTIKALRPQLKESILKEVTYA